MSSQEESRKRLKEEEEEEDDDEVEQEDDEEEDDDDEEDDDEDDEKLRKSKKKKSKRSRMFLDEASEGSEEESGDEDDVEIESEEDVLTPYQQEERSKRINQARVFELQARAEDVAKKYEERARQIRRSEITQSTTGGVATIETARLLRERPKPDDPKLFMVKCKPGKERLLVIKLFNKYIRDKFKKAEPVDQVKKVSRFILPPPPGAELEIYSVVASGSHGFIYVEAEKEEYVKAAIRGVTDLYGGNVSVVPLNEMPDTMRVELNREVVKKDDYVLMRGPFPYKGDLAKVYAVLEGGNKVTVMLVPRIDMSTLSLNIDSKDANRIAPPAKHFNADEIREAGGNLGRELYQDEMMDTFDGHFFHNGYLLLDVSVRKVQIMTERPSVQDLQRFQRSQGDQVDALAKDLSSVASKQRKEKFEFTIGDRVLVVAGAEQGVTGILENVELDRGVGKLRTDVITFDISLRNLVKQFVVGDHVKVVSGKYKGKTGTVMNVPPSIPGQAPSVFINTDITEEELQVNNSDLEVSAEVSAGAVELAGFKLYDLVMLDQNQHGVIARLAGDSVRVVTQNGQVREVPASGIRANKNHESKRAMVLDMSKQTIKENDHVNVVAGPQRGNSGVVKHIFHMTLFIYSKRRENENAGIIVAKSTDCKIAGAIVQPRGNLGGPGMYNNGPSGGGGGGPGMRPPQMMNRGGGGFHSGPPQAPVVRPPNDMVGKTVRIRRGYDKGLMGSVINGGSATSYKIELNEGRVIVVPKDDVEPLDSNNSASAGGTSGYSSFTPSASYYGSNPPSGAYSYGTPAATTLAAPYVDQGTTGRFKKGDRVRVLDTGEQVTIYNVVGDREVLILDKSGKPRKVAVTALAQI